MCTMRLALHKGDGIFRRLEKVKTWSTTIIHPYANSLRSFHLKVSEARVKLGITSGYARPPKVRDILSTYLIVNLELEICPVVSSLPRRIPSYMLCGVSGADLQNDTDLRRYNN